MQHLVKLFSSWIQFVYHTFDRIVINGYLDFFRADNHVVFFFQQVRQEPIITKAVETAMSSWIDLLLTKRPLSTSMANSISWLLWPNRSSSRKARSLAFAWTKSE